MFVWWRWIKHRFPRLRCGRSWHGSFLARAASKGSAVRHKGMRPQSFGLAVQATRSVRSAGVCVVVRPLWPHIPRPPGGLTLVRGRVCYAATSPRPALSGPPLRGRARTLSRLRRVPPFARRTASRHVTQSAVWGRGFPDSGKTEGLFPMSGKWDRLPACLRRTVSNAWKSASEIFQTLEQNVPGFGKSVGGVLFDPAGKLGVGE